MSARSIFSLVAIALLATPLPAAKQRGLEEVWTQPDYERRSFGKIVVVGITDDEEVRKRFENKFVSHLRGRRIQASVSYGVAPDLTAMPSREQVMVFIDDESIDAAISIRVVSLADRSEEQWGAAWREAARGRGTLRELIQESLPTPQTKAKSYGIEVSLWDADKRIRIWSARTNPYTRKQMRKGAGEFVQLVIDALKRERLL